MMRVPARPRFLRGTHWSETGGTARPGRGRAGRPLLFFGLNYSPELTGIGPYTAGLAEELTRRGHRVQALVGQPYYPRWRIEKAAGGAWSHERLHGVGVTRCPLYVPRRPTVLRRMVHYLSFALSSTVPLLRLLIAERPAVVFAVAPSLLACMVPLIPARILRIPFWLHLQDFEVEMAVATGLVGKRGLAARLAIGFEGVMLRAADMVSTISPAMAARLEAKGVAPQRIVQLRNWATQAERLKHPGLDDGAGSWGLCGRTVALYAGTIAAKQGLEVVVEAARLLQERGDLAFVICGEGANRAELEAAGTGLANLVFLPLQQPDRFAQLLRRADIHLLPQTAGAADLVLPSKLPNMLASGRPVIVTALPGTGLAEEVEGCGLVTPPGDPRALAEAVEALLADPALAERLGEEGERRARERWALRGVADRFEAALADLLVQGGNP